MLHASSCVASDGEKHKSEYCLSARSKAEMCSGGFGTEVLGLSRNYWSFIFQAEPVDDTVTDPRMLIVLVDADTEVSK
jgi:hypothetical protein